VSKKHLAQRGWIIFTGLRYARKFATREELVREIRGFFERRGVTDFGKLHIDFIWLDSAPPRLYGDYFTHDYGKHAWIRIFMRRKRSGKKHFLRTLFHELDHHWWKLQGRVFTAGLPYPDKPYERRAIRVGARQAARVIQKVA